MTAAAGELLRVLNCLHSLEPGGVERVVLRFSKAWRDHGIDARIALGRFEGALRDDMPDVPLFVLRAGRRPRAAFDTLRMIWLLPAVIRAFRPHVLFCGSNGLAIVGFAMRLRFGRKCPAIVLKISQDLLRPDMSALALRLDRYALRLHAWVYARVVAIAAPARAQIIGEMGIPAERVVVINNASMTMADVHRFAATRDAAIAVRERAANQGRHFVGIGRLVPQKNFALLIEAFATVAGPADRLTIVGEGPCRASLEAMARTLHVADRVRLPGYQRDPAPWLADADAFVLSSDFEGIGNVVVEALAAGVPVVVTHCSAAMPMLAERAGRLVPIKNAHALAQAMDMICDTPVDIAEMRTRAAQFTTEATTPQWLTLFASVAR